jgi:lipopolysaccharide export system permease protein
MACLVAVLQAFSRLGADAEITALKASGVNLSRMMRPVVIAFSLVALGELLFVDQVLPRTNHNLKNLLLDIARKKPTFELREQAINEFPNSLFLRAGRIDQASDQMRDVVIYDLSNPTRRRTIYADSGYIRLNAAGTDLFLTLFDGYIHDYDRSESGSFRRIFYQTDLVRVGEVTNYVNFDSTGSNDYGRGDREMSLCEMEQIVKSALANARAMETERRRATERDLLSLVGIVAPRGDTARPDSTHRSLTAVYCDIMKRIKGAATPTAAQAQTPNRLDTSAAARARLASRDTLRRHPVIIAPDPSGAQLRATLVTINAQQAAIRRQAATYQVEIHKKFSLAVSCIVFVLIGAPIALRFPRGGIGLVIGCSVAIFGIYYIGLIGGESFADRRIISPFWAMWTPNIIMASLGLLLFQRLGTEKATSRGGGIVEYVRGKFRRRKARRA